MKHFKRYFQKIPILFLILLVVFSFTACSAGAFSEVELPKVSQTPQAAAPQGDSSEPLRLIFIDVGQGDSMLLTTPSGKNMLIDSGESDAYESVKNTLGQYGITRLDYVLCTHPHSDHIGSMYKILSEFEIGACYLPNATHTSRTFEKMIEALEENDIPTVEAKKGVQIDLGDGVLCSMYSPYGEELDNLNNYSPILRITYGETAFLLSGDAEKEMEARVLAAGDDLSCNVMKLAHHGSTTSNTEAFIDAAAPELAICSVGEGNSYGHPHQEILELLERKQIPLMRTDELGSITVFSDGTSVTTQTEKDSPAPEVSESAPDNMEETADVVYKTKSGKAYHRIDCPSCSKSTMTPVTREEAEALGLHACPNCEP